MSYQEYRPSSFSMLPPVIKNLLIINILLFFAKLVFEAKLGINLDNILGLHYFSAPDFKPYQFVSYMFMHGDFRHLFFNLFAVWMFGSVLENYWGSKRFLIYYLITGLGAALIQYIVFYFELSPVISQITTISEHLTIQNFEELVNTHEFQGNFNYNLYNHFQEFTPLYNKALGAGNTALALSLAQQYLSEFKDLYCNSFIIVGASGALFGILLAYGMIFPNTEIYFYFFFPVKAKWFVAIYGVIELISGISQRTGDNVAHFAHLGGMLFGFILIMLWKKNRNYFY